MLTANLWLVAVVLGVVAFTASLVLMNKRKKHRYQSPKIKMKLEKVTEDMLDTPSKEDGYDLDGIGSVRTQSFSRDTKSTVDTAQSDHENQLLNDTQVQRSQAADPLDDLSFSGEVPKQQAVETFDETIAPESVESGSEYEPSTSLDPNAPSPYSPDPLVIQLTVISRDDAGFKGSELMQLAIALGLRFGDMSIFHRHKEACGTGPVQFSMALAHNPGHFDIDKLPGQAIKGVTFFMQVPGQSNQPIQTFRTMLKTAKRIAEELSGVVLDQSRVPLDHEGVVTLERYIQQKIKQTAGFVA